MHKNEQNQKWPKILGHYKFFLFLKKIDFLEVGLIVIVQEGNHKVVGSKMDTPNPLIWPLKVGWTMNGHKVRRWLNLFG